MAAQAAFSIWEGYRPTPRGYEQSYHVRRHPSTGKWTVTMRLQGDTFFALPGVSTGVDEVVAHTLNLTRKLGLPPGGGITVNEFKQVIKPVYAGRGYGIVPIYLGRFPTFHVVFPDGARRIDNSDDHGFKTGELWPHQKIAMRYLYRAGRDDLNMVQGDFYNEVQVSFRDELGIDCSYLAQLLREAKNGSGGVFYVNEHGLVFAPRYDPWAAQDDSGWSAVYVGKIDYQRWLSPESAARRLPGI